MFKYPLCDVDPEPSISSAEGCEIDDSTRLGTEAKTNRNRHVYGFSFVRLIYFNNWCAGLSSGGNKPSETGRCAVLLEFFFAD